MKKLLFLGLILTLFAGALSAQQTRNDRFSHQREIQSSRHGQLNRVEVRHLRNDGLRYKIARRRALHDGNVSRFERRRLHNMKRDQRRDRFRFRHNNRRRVI